MSILREINEVYFMFIFRKHLIIIKNEKKKNHAKKINQSYITEKAERIDKRQYLIASKSMI